MPKNTSVSLSDHFDRFIAEQVKAGHYGSASEVVRDGLRLLEERQIRMQALRAELQAGLDSGIAEEFDIDEWLAEKTSETPRPRSPQAVPA
ncbi:type II toxin-antitoxin system ParD family antitoxin [Sphingosinicella sp. BN140058]|uniref:type II toxin-antitoxin system ParD family antitoxin n=1 Tax=Sphingosinicella sp. BN140058 TaxID=1892855 RepID=UPI0010108195|nr:type II toxin-antitoxin system ParD family antitoxin [Sphingosinicella sp. BN140058]QAY78704.1 type II toxin-antitoxin system ParD family antitoxin [Sphingosinicella sp. BN140058]